MTEQPFDFEAFIAGARLAEDTFTLYLVDNGRQIERLKAEIDATKTVADDREATVAADTTDLEQQVASLVAQMRESKREFTLRAVTPDELAKIGEPGTDIYDQLAVQSVKPALNRDQWQRVGEVVGAQQFSAFVSQANALATSKVAVPDFSPNDSTSQDLRESSAS